MLDEELNSLMFVIEHRETSIQHRFAIATNDRGRIIKNQISSKLFGPQLFLEILPQVFTPQLEF